MLDYLREIRLRELAAGANPTVVILWLSGSFRIDARRMGADAKRFEHLSALYKRLQASTHDLTARRKLTLGVPGAVAGGHLNPRRG